MFNNLIVKFIFKTWLELSMRKEIIVLMLILNLVCVSAVSVDNKCKDGEKWDSYWQKCQSACTLGYEYKEGECVSKCDSGEHWDMVSKKCVSSSGYDKEESNDINNPTNEPQKGFFTKVKDFFIDSWYFVKSCFVSGKTENFDKQTPMAIAGTSADDSGYAIQTNQG